MFSECSFRAVAVAPILRTYRRGVKAWPMGWRKYGQHQCLTSPSLEWWGGDCMSFRNILLVRDTAMPLLSFVVRIMQALPQSGSSVGPSLACELARKSSVLTILCYIPLKYLPSIAQLVERRTVDESELDILRSLVHIWLEGVILTCVSKNGTNLNKS